MRRLLPAVVLAAAVLLLSSLPAEAAERSGTDPAGDVRFARGDITSWRARHTAANVDLRVRTLHGGWPVANWPNFGTRIVWNLNTDPEHPGIEYKAVLRIVHGFDTVFVGRVFDQSDTLVCEAQEGDPAPLTVIWDENLYRFLFPRTCIGSPASFRARASFTWDRGAVGPPVEIDLAPDANPTGPIAAG